MLAAILIAMLVASSASAPAQSGSASAVLLATGLEGGSGSAIGPGGALHVTEANAGRVARGGKHPGRSDICGDVAPHPPAPARPDITLYAGCIAGTVDRLWRWPRIGALEWGSVAGVVLAHEVAHVLAAVHASTGIMRANLGVAEWQAFVAGTLAFSENDAAQLRAARLDDASGQSASVSWWRSDL